MVSPQARREQVAFVCQRGLSKRRACGLIGIARSGLSYELHMHGKDAPVIEAMKRLSAQLWDLMACARLELVRRARGGQADHAGVMVESRGDAALTSPQRLVTVQAAIRSMPARR
jgi:hypothetical protein